MRMFTITMLTDNPAFHDMGREQEVARILRELAARLTNGDATFDQMIGTLSDVNGNEVGCWIAN